MNIDYPEYDDVEEMTHRVLVEKATSVKKEIESLLTTSQQGKSYVRAYLLLLLEGQMLGSLPY